jgi:uncharacterized protein (TIGR03435 family)
MQAIASATLVAILVWPALGQTEPAFEVASVKRSGPKSIRMFDGGPGKRDPERISYTCATLHDLLYEAYQLKDYQQISGPNWLGEEKYDISAKIPPGTTKEQFRGMLRNLLAERFLVALHHETREFRVYELVIAKNGPKLDMPLVAKDGFPVLPEGRPGMSTSYTADGHARLTARQQPLSVLADSLRTSAGALVVNKTGLPGKYDFTLEYSWRDMGPDGENTAAGLFDAVQQQLGLKLEPKKLPFDVLVIEHAEKVPVEN